MSIAQSLDNHSNRQLSMIYMDTLTKDLNGSVRVAYSHVNSGSISGIIVLKKEGLKKTYHFGDPVPIQKSQIDLKTNIFTIFLGGRRRWPLEILF